MKNKFPWEYEVDYNDPKKYCQIDCYPEEPGRYICQAPLSSNLPHCLKCSLHHGPSLSCEAAGELEAIDQQLLSYAR